MNKLHKVRGSRERRPEAGPKMLNSEQGEKKSFR